MSKHIVVMGRFMASHAMYPLQLKEVQGACAEFGEVINKGTYPEGYDYFNSPENGLYLKHFAGSFDLWLNRKEVVFCPFCGESISIKIEPYEIIESLLAKAKIPGNVGKEDYLEISGGSGSDIIVRVCQHDENGIENFAQVIFTTPSGGGLKNFHPQTMAILIKLAEVIKREFAT